MSTHKRTTRLAMSLSLAGAALLGCDGLPPDPATGETAMFSVPRNWTQAPLPAGMGVWDCDCYPELINELWTAGE
ncbi:MAG: hypothetical protein ABFS41_09180, partial [Myxococcota bacterium]